MVDIAQLGYAIDTSQVTRATQELQKHQQAAQGVARSATDMQQATSRGATGVTSLGRAARAATGQLTLMRAAIIGTISGIVGGAIVGVALSAINSLTQAALDYAHSIISNGPAIEASIKQQAAVIDGLKDAWDRAKKGAFDYLRTANSVRLADAIAAEREANRLAASEASSFPGVNRLPGSAASILFSGSDPLGPYGAATRQFMAGDRSDVIGFYNQVSQIQSQQPAGSAMFAVGQQIREDLESARQAQARAAQMKDAVAAARGDIEATRRLLGDSYAQTPNASAKSDFGVPPTATAVSRGGAVKAPSVDFSGAASAVGTVTDAMAGLTASLDEFRGVSKDVLGGFVRDLIAGKSAAEALSNTLLGLATRIADAGVNSLIGGLFGQQGQLGGGLFGNALLGAFGGGGAAPASGAASAAGSAVNYRNIGMLNRQFSMLRG